MCTLRIIPCGSEAGFDDDAVHNPAPMNLQLAMNSHRLQEQATEHNEQTRAPTMRDKSCGLDARVRALDSAVHTYTYKYISIHMHKKHMHVGINENILTCMYGADICMCVGMKISI